MIALAKKRGVKTINVVRRSEQKQELLDLGCARWVPTPMPCQHWLRTLVPFNALSHL